MLSRRRYRLRLRYCLENIFYSRYPRNPLLFYLEETPPPEVHEFFFHTSSFVLYFFNIADYFIFGNKKAPLRVLFQLFFISFWFRIVFFRFCIFCLLFNFFLQFILNVFRIIVRIYIFNFGIFL